MHGQLEREIDALYLEDAPKQVTDAAQEALRCVRSRLPVPQFLGDVLRKYAASRATQNRYGK